MQHRRCRDPLRVRTGGIQAHGILAQRLRQHRQQRRHHVGPANRLDRMGVAEQGRLRGRGERGRGRHGLHG